MLISAAELHLSLQTPSTRIIDCRFDLANPTAGRETYLSGHIPGAHYLDLNQDLSAPVTKHGGRHPLPGIRAFEHRLRALGAQTDSQFVLYDSSRGAYACRLWWMLTRAGITNVRLLDGGFNAWRNGDFPFEQGEPPTTVTGNIRLAECFAGIQTREQLLNQRPCLVDSREPSRYRGEQEPIDPVAGHIPGARNLPWQSATDEQGFFLAPDAQAERWRAAGIDLSGDPAVVYCGSGVTACVNIFSAALTGADTDLYPGSWSDWCSYLTPENQSALVATER
ncbi:sulfurtransferase [Simiduia agarivorans]|uniref:Thiosulfate sulfurtransferase n=1 Tax=Simiduia agarivorans (strain DSM 21679 / JCM 13881 / BCRC 17597 / SA1) TaxID=1117647 RepID=K4KTJ3_SIMAS|nr:sulfurtransferase [Simiduia agarivorans]AFU97282.1 thiosulfate sulfurtransferase [Simiduia agarivorans SA1 = DSM 21679]